MAKLVRSFIIFGPVDGNIKILKKYANPGQTFDESLISTLCLPRIELVDKPKEPRFQTFLVTKEDGLVLYGSGLIIYDRIDSSQQYASYCYTIITDTPFINATRSLLHLIWDKRCDDIIIRSIMNIPLPPRKGCLRIVPLHRQKTIDDIYLYTGMTGMPLLDYPLRELFSFINVEEFLIAFACILMEFRTLIISQDNYKLMMVGETLTSLLLPLKWCNVYVPILPPVYGATYLDAPTSYIMGINTQVTEIPDNLQHVQCRIYCDKSRVECDVDSLTLPLFLNDIKIELINIISNHEASHTARQTTYLDDLKFNRAVRVLFMKTIRKNILANYDRYIVDVPESSADIRQFDVVSYLSDQPEFMHSFLSKFLDTQLFASFIDENAKRIQSSWISKFDLDPDQLSAYFTDEALEQAFKRAHRVHLMDLREEHPGIEVKTVPASPMKLRRRVPGLASLASRLSYATSKWSSNNATSVDQSTSTNSPVALVPSSPPTHRNSVATVSLQGHLLIDPSLHPSSVTDKASHNNSPHSLRPNAVVSPQVPNGKIVELINEVKDLTKSIIIETMGYPTQQQGATNYDNGSNDCNTLIGELCDLIERVWSHGAFASHQDKSICCPLWNHLISFSRLKYLDSRPAKNQFADGSHLNVLSPALKSVTTELDKVIVQNSNPFSNFNWFKLNKFRQVGSLERDLINDLKVIHLLKDVKTDVGKARAFIRLSLERKKLSKHLKTLIGDQTLLISLYKPYAFLRYEEEREQFLMYLLTLNAVDLPCYTTTFVSVINTRKLRETTTQ